MLVVTGANRGVGFHTARHAAAGGVPVVLVCRDRRRGEAALERLGGSSSGHELVLADLSDWDSVRSAAARIRSGGRPVRGLVNNAAVLPRTRRLNHDGVELQMAVNHLAHVLLIQCLLPSLRAGAPSRIVTVSSGSHAGPPVDLDDPAFEARPYRRLVAYQQSKMAGVAYTLALARRLGGSEVEAAAVHPGVYGTGLLGDWTGLGPLTRFVVPGPGRGGRIVARVAVQEGGVAGPVNGLYFNRGRATAPSSAALDREHQERVWEWSHRMVGL